MSFLTKVIIELLAAFLGICVNLQGNIALIFSPQHGKETMRWDFRYWF